MEETMLEPVVIDLTPEDDAPAEETQVPEIVPDNSEPNVSSADENRPPCVKGAGELCSTEGLPSRETGGTHANPGLTQDPAGGDIEPTTAPDYGPLLARYPGFNPDTDGADPSFAALVAAGVPTDKAYEVLHMDDLLLGAMEYASRRTLERLAGSALAGRSRPAENGLAAGQPAQTALDPRTMTRQQFKDLKERVYRGEKVYL